ncbi:MAG: phage holin family protein [Candidatus Andersenbacteria bacterium]
MNIFIRWIILTIAVLITSYILPGVAVGGFVAALVTAAVLGIINAFLKPFLVILTLPVTIVTLGLFLFVINALLVQLASVIVPDFSVSSFLWALAFSVILSLVSYVLHTVTPEPDPG